MKINELFNEKTVLSFEVFPPKPTNNGGNIYETLQTLAKLSPDYISVTYGTGSNLGFSKTLELASAVKNKLNTESVAHLPCSNLSKENIVNILNMLKANNIDNILALRGNAAPSQTSDFKHADEVISFINSIGGFNISAACYPEGHPESESIVSDINYLKRKVEAGAGMLISQLFLDNNYFYRFLERISLAGIDVPVQAGIMPVTNKKQIERMVSMCNIKLPKKFLQIIDKYEYNAEALRDAGIAYAVDQIVDLTSNDVSGIHLYTMNKPYIAEKIYSAVQNLIAV